MSLTKAKADVFRLLRIRLRSEREIRAKLKEKKYEPAIIDEVVEYFKGIEQIDDRRFAKGWIASRTLKPFGLSRIKSELIQKGIARDTIEEELEKAAVNFSEEDAVLALAKKRAAKYAGVDPTKRKQRVYGYLLRRGFSPGSVMKALHRL